MRMSAIVGSSRCVNRSMPWIQKSPSRLGVGAPIVAIGRPRTRLEFAYACQYRHVPVEGDERRRQEPEIAAVRTTGRGRRRP